MLLSTFRLFSIGLIILYSQSLTAKSDLPKSNINIGLGAGMHYGIFGTKTVIGYKNSGLMIGLGYLPPGLPGYSAGLQLSLDVIYFNVSYGTIGSATVNDMAPDPILAGNATVGGMINLNSNKRTFLDLAVGHSFGATPTDLGILGEANNNGITLSIGVQFRLGGEDIH